MGNVHGLWLALACVFGVLGMLLVVLSCFACYLHRKNKQYHKKWLRVTTNQQRAKQREQKTISVTQGTVDVMTSRQYRGSVNYNSQVNHNELLDVTTNMEESCSSHEDTFGFRVHARVTSEVDQNSGNMEELCSSNEDIVGLREQARICSSYEDTFGFRVHASEQDQKSCSSYEDTIGFRVHASEEDRNSGNMEELSSSYEDVVGIREQARITIKENSVYT